MEKIRVSSRFRNKSSESVSLILFCLVLGITTTFFIIFDFNVNFVIFLLIMVSFTLIYYYRYGKDSSLLQFKIAALISFGSPFVGLIGALGAGESNISLIVGLLFFITLIIEILFIIEYISRIVIKNNETINTILKKSSDSSIEIANQAIELTASANEVNSSALEISAATSEVASLTRTIMVSSDDIEKIMDIIISVSEKTNLLAYNASLEAVKAGEKGRGFAIVAEEVRNLAEKSKQSVEKSNQNIQSIMEEIQKANDSMESINNSSEEQTTAMKDIIAAATRLGMLSEALKEKLSKYG